MDQEFKVKQLSSNGFVRFFQKIGRALSLWWTKFSFNHPKISKLLFEFFKFWVFSMMVTIFQYLVMTFLPYAFGTDLAAKEFLWPKVEVNIPGYEPFYWSILGYAVAYNDVGEVIIGGGLGYFIAYELATFFAQVINFPLQRNFTYKSKGNPYFQAMWFFIAWVIISLLCNAITSMWIGWAIQVFNPALYSILTTFITGGVSMIVFFFVNKIIFPDLQKTSASLNKKVEKLEASNASPEKIAKAKEKAEKMEKAAKLDTARKDSDRLTRIADSKVLTYYSMKAEFDKAPTEDNSQLLKKLYEETKQAVAEAEAAVKLYDELRKGE